MCISLRVMPFHLYANRNNLPLLELELNKQNKMHI